MSTLTQMAKLCGTWILVSTSYFIFRHAQGQVPSSGSFVTGTLLFGAFTLRIFQSGSIRKDWQPLLVFYAVSAIVLAAAVVLHPKELTDMLVGGLIAWSLPTGQLLFNSIRKKST